MAFASERGAAACSLAWQRAGPYLLLIIIIVYFSLAWQRAGSYFGDISRGGAGPHRAKMARCVSATCRPFACLCACLCTCPHAGVTAAAGVARLCKACIVMAHIGMAYLVMAAAGVGQALQGLYSYGLSCYGLSSYGCGWGRPGFARARSYTHVGTHVGARVCAQVWWRQVRSMRPRSTIFGSGPPPSTRSSLS